MAFEYCNLIGLWDTSPHQARGVVEGGVGVVESGAKGLRGVRRVSSFRGEPEVEKVQ